jgi:hypothetical protein
MLNCYGQLAREQFIAYIGGFLCRDVATIISGYWESNEETRKHMRIMDFIVQCGRYAGLLASFGFIESTVQTECWCDACELITTMKRNYRLCDKKVSPQEKLEITEEIHEMCCSQVRFGTTCSKFSDQLMMYITSDDDFGDMTDYNERAYDTHDFFIEFSEADLYPSLRRNTERMGLVSQLAWLCLGWAIPIRQDYLPFVSSGFSELHGHYDVMGNVLLNVGDHDPIWDDPHSDEESNIDYD